LEQVNKARCDFSVIARHHHVGEVGVAELEDLRNSGDALSWPDFRTNHEESACSHLSKAFALR
jgi:hypothetical protein